MTLLDRHIFRSALVTCLAAVAVFTFVVMTAGLAKDLSSPDALGKLSWFQIAQLTALMIPIGASWGLPLGMLVGVLMALSRLSADNEITGMRAAGVSLKRISGPIVLLGLLGAVLEIPLVFGFMPHARVSYEHEFAEAVRADPLSFVVPRTFVRIFKGYVVYIGDRKGRDLSDVWFWKLDSQNRMTVAGHARSGTIDYDPKAFQVILSGRDGQVERLDETNPESFAADPKLEKNAAPMIITTNQDPQRVPLEGIFVKSPARQKLPWMTYGELRAERVRRAHDPLLTLKERAHAVMQVTMAAMDKLTMAVAVFTFAFIAVPLGIQVSRRETSASLVLGVIIAITYYVLTISIDMLDRHPEYRPDLLVWLPNVMMLALGFALFRRIDRRRA